MPLPGGESVFGRYSRPEPDAIEVIIGPRASFRGNLQCEASIRIDGTVTGGVVETPSNVILTETAQAECDIQAKTVSIRGVYKGTINAHRVELLAGSQVFGALNVESFFMDEGVLLRAELNIQTPEERALTAVPAPGQPLPEQSSPNRTKTSIPVVRPPAPPPASPGPSAQGPLAEDPT